jgi:hypothetical protein
VGTWKDADDVLDNTIDGQPGRFTGRGGGIEVDANGQVTQQFGPRRLAGRQLQTVQKRYFQ